ncbi:MAG: transporter substrate-binding protein [Burkholderiaceae bacterium]|nr:transporter substrate-binding protein [Burkholderiaceae bacterium]
MTINRRGFIKTAAGVLAYASSFNLLAQSNIDSTNPIKVANLLDKTGVLNNYCLKQIKAAAMAVDEINASGGLLGRKVEINFYDTQSSNRLYSQYATQAFVRDKVDVIHGAVASSAREVVRPIVQRFKGLYFYNALYEGGVCDRRHVCTGMVPAQELEPLVDYVIKERNAKKHYILAADYNYGHITSKWLQKFIREKGGEDVAVEFFPLDVTNFAPVLSRIQSAKPDAVWSALVGDAHMSFYRQFESTIGKKNMSLIGTVYGAARENAMLSAQENDGTIIAASFIDTLPTDAARGFVKRFADFTGETDYIGEYGEYGYRGMMLWAEAVKRAGSVDPDKVIAALPGTTFAGPGGLYTIDDQSNHTIMDIHIAVGNKDKGFDVIKSFQQQPPSDTQEVCNLRENPNDTKQYEPKV